MLCIHIVRVVFKLILHGSNLPMKYCTNPVFLEVSWEQIRTV